MFSIDFFGLAAWIFIIVILILCKIANLNYFFPHMTGTFFSGKIYDGLSFYALQTLLLVV